MATQRKKPAPAAPAKPGAAKTTPQTPRKSRTPRPREAFKGLENEDTDIPHAHDMSEDTAFQTLSIKHQRFVSEYVIELNATKAYMQAYPGTEAPTAGANGYKLLKNAHILRGIKEVQANVLGHLGITHSRILREAARLAFADVADLYDEEGRLRMIHEMSADARATIASVETLEEFEGSGDQRVKIGYTRKVKLNDKKGAIELLMRHASLLNDKLKVQHDAADPLKALLAELHGGALPVVKVDPEINVAPGAILGKKKAAPTGKKWRAA